jgi:fermentation-respiration switch protein FrsA (DUF1100 family)
MYDSKIIMKSKTANWRYWLNLFIATMVVLIIMMAGLVVWMSYRQTQAYLHPPRYIASGESLTANNIEYTEIELTTSDGVKLSAWYTAPKNGALILVAHGYGAVRPVEFYDLFASHGYGVLAWDFRAHGKSGGNFSTLGYYEQLDVEAALDYALAQPDVKHIGAWGGSMGGAAIILTAARRPEIEALIIDSAFPTLEDVYKINVPFPIFQPLVRFFAERETGVDFDNVRPVDEIAKISPRPLFIIDGWQGAAIVMNSPQRLFDAAGSPKLLWVEQGVPHLNMYAHYRKEYARRVIDFFDEFLK